MIYIFHCWGNTPKDHWYNSVRLGLEKKGYNVLIPELKDPNAPILKDWLNSMKNFELKEGDSIIGHSLGGPFALQYIMQQNVKLDTLITVSGWDYWDLTPELETFFTPAIDHKKIRSLIDNKYVVHSSNDPYVTVYSAKGYADRIDAEYIQIEDGGHITKDDGFDSLDIVIDLFK